MKLLVEPKEVELLHQIPEAVRSIDSNHPALKSKRGGNVSYDLLNREITRIAGGLLELGVERGSRVLINLPNLVELVVAVFATTRVGAIAVPTNANLSRSQVHDILIDSAPTVIISMVARLERLGIAVRDFPSVRALVACDAKEAGDGILPWRELSGPARQQNPAADDLAAILYTSGSSGRAKGVALSHANMVLGAKSVAHYIDNSPEDRLLATLPLSFDAGLSQVTTALLRGGTAVLHEYLFPVDVAHAIREHQITGLTGVPSLWSGLARLDWAEGSGDSLRYFANTGGKLQPALLERLTKIFPAAKPFLMYGLTEAFRSTFLPPEQLMDRAHSIGKAIPNAEVFVLGSDGKECDPFEHGEIVHVGPLVSQGYWNGASSSYAHFSDAPSCATVPGRAVWTGDIGYRDEEGYLYFVARRDEMIKTSGYRVSPVEVESAATACPEIHECCAFGVEIDGGDQVIWLVASPREPGALQEVNDRLTGDVLMKMREGLPRYAIPSRVRWVEVLPRDLNGKVNRQQLKASLMDAVGANSR